MFRIFFGLSKLNIFSLSEGFVGKCIVVQQSLFTVVIIALGNGVKKSQFFKDRKDSF
jgi:hypothetical protein